LHNKLREYALGREERHAIRHFGQHPPDLCPTSNTKTRQRIEQMMAQLEAAQKRHNVSVRSGHVLGMSHRLVVCTEAPNVEAVRDFVMETGLVQ
jgi:hypothetical protein